MAPPLRNVPVLRWRWLLPAAVLVLAFHLSPFGPALDRSFYDLASRHPLRRTPIPEGSAIVLVDEATLAAASKLDGMRWPFSRPAFAGLIAALDRAGASKIVFDFTFFEESERAEWDLILGSVAAAVPTLVLARTKNREPVFWPKSFVSAHSALFQRPRTGEVDFQPDEDGIVRHYHIPHSLVAVAFDPPAAAGGGLLQWHGSLRDIR